MGDGPATSEHPLGSGHGHMGGHDVFDSSSPERYRASRRVTAVSLGINSLLSLGQILGGVFGHSQALIADGVHTLSDIITDSMVLFALKHGAKEADEEHPYGHGRIETAVTVVLGAMLIAVAIGIAINAGLRLANPESIPIPAMATLIVAIITIVSKEGLFRYTMHTARRYQSNLLRANAWHHRSDAISSVIVFLGIGGSLLGWRYLDGLAAVGVAMMVAKIGWELAWSSVKELIDTALDADIVAEIKASILAMDDVKSLHMLRTRRAGGQALADVHIIVDSDISVSEGHHISENVRARLIEKFDAITDVTVHIDPEDDELFPPNAGLPLRTEVDARLERYFAAIPEASQIQAVTLHYLNGRIQLQILLPLSVAADPAAATALEQRFAQAVTQDPDIGTVSLRFH